MAPTLHPSPSLPAVKIVWEMLLGDAKVFKWLLVARFKGAFAGPAVEQLARGIGAPLPQGRATEGTEVTVLLLSGGKCTRGQ